MKGKLFVFCGVVLIALAVLLIAHKAAGAEVEVASLDSGQPPTWLRGYGERTVGAAEAGSSGRTIQIPEPVFSYLWSADSEDFSQAVSWNFLNFPKDNKRWCADVGRLVDGNMWFVDLTYNIGSLADIVELPLAQYVNPRPGIYGGYNFDASDVDYGLSLVLVQVSF